MNVKKLALLVGLGASAVAFPLNAKNNLVDVKCVDSIFGSSFLEARGVYVNQIGTMLVLTNPAPPNSIMRFNIPPGVACVEMPHRLELPQGDNNNSDG